MKPMRGLTFEETLELWNRGFEGYAMNMTMTMERLVSRFGLEGLSPDMSVVAFDGDKPVGFIMNAIREVHGKLVSWNGGTGVIPEYRRQGVGRAMMEETLRVYEQNHVQLATLEAIRSNVKAIALYQQMGYDVVDELVFYQHAGAFEQVPFVPVAKGLRMDCGMAYEVSRLSFYKPFGAWQTQWQNVRDGESVIAFDASGQPVGYALFKRMYDPESQQVTVSLLQCEVALGQETPKSIAAALCTEVFRPTDATLKRGTVNLSRRNDPLIPNLLEEAGFTVRAEQVYMTRHF